MPPKAEQTKKAVEAVKKTKQSAMGMPGPDLSNPKAQSGFDASQGQNR